MAVTLSHAGHWEIDYHKVGGKLSREFNRLRSSGGFADNLEVFRHGQKTDQALPHDRMIVNQ